MNATCRPQRLLAALASAAALLAACGAPATPVAQSSPTPSSSSSPTPAVLTCTLGGPASTSWPPPGYLSAATIPPSPILSAEVSGDTLTLRFVQGTPEFEVALAPSAHFTETNGRGDPVDLSGSAGVSIILRGFRGDMLNYAGPRDFTSNGALLLEVRDTGEYEGVVGWAAGLSKPGCASVIVGGSTLTFTFIPSPFAHS